MRTKRKLPPCDPKTSQLLDRANMFLNQAYFRHKYLNHACPATCRMHQIVFPNSSGVELALTLQNPIRGDSFVFPHCLSWVWSSCSSKPFVKDEHPPAWESTYPYLTWIMSTKLERNGFNKDTYAALFSEPDKSVQKKHSSVHLVLWSHFI